MNKIVIHTYAPVFFWICFCLALFGVVFVFAYISPDPQKLIDAKTMECDSKGGTFLPIENVCLDVRSIQLAPRK
jgi:uncharacterized membrane protein